MLENMSSNSSSIKLTHKWSIENCGDLFLRGFASASFIQSDFFQLPQVKEKLNFFLRLYSKGINREVHKEDDEDDDKESESKVTQSFMSLYLYLQDGADIDVQCTFSIMDYNDKMCNTKSIKGLLSKYSEMGIDEYIPNNSLIFTRNRYFKAKTMLTLVCEIEIPVRILTICNGLNSAPSSLEHQNVITTTSKSDASATVIKHNYQWTIPLYDFIYQRNICSASHNFSLKKKEGVNFFLRLWPNGKGKCNAEYDYEAENEKFLALFLYLSDCVSHNCVKALSRLSVRDMKNSKIHHSRWIYGELFGSNGLGCERFLAIDRANELLRENELDINCEVELFCEEESNPENVEEINAHFLNSHKSIIINSSFSNSPLNIQSTSKSGDFTIKK